VPVIAIPRANTTTMASSHLLCNTFPIQTSCNLSSKSNISSFKPSGSFSFCQKLQFQRTPVVKATRKQVEVCTSILCCLCFGFKVLNCFFFFFVFVLFGWFCFHFSVVCCLCFEFKF
jgi:hypothetical protein